MEIMITEEDDVEALGGSKTAQLKETKKEEILGEKDGPAGKEILDALPKVLVDRFQRMIPKDYEVRQVELKVTISGQPFGVGVGGEAMLIFGPKIGA